MNIGVHVRSGVAEPVEDPFAKQRKSADIQSAQGAAAKDEADTITETTPAQPTSPVTV